VYVRIRDEEWNIYRRFSHFHSMHAKLRRKYPIVATVAFPKKKAIGNKVSGL
jgi:sorting nexin-29